MFIISQYLLKKSNLIPDILTISTYSVVIGLIIYASIYVYFLMYNNDFLPFFNKIIPYVIGIDLLLSTIYYYTLQNSSSTETLLNDDTNKYDGNDGNEMNDDMTETDAESDSDSSCENTEDNYDENASTEIDDTQVLQEQDQEEIVKVVSKPPSPPPLLQDNDMTNDSCDIENINITQLPSHVNNTNVVVSIINDESESQKTVKKRKRRTKKEIERDMLMQELKLKLSENNKNRIDDSVKPSDEDIMNTNEIDLD